MSPPPGCAVLYGENREGCVSCVTPARNRSLGRTGTDRGCCKVIICRHRGSREGHKIGVDYASSCSCRLPDACSHPMVVADVGSWRLALRATPLGGDPRLTRGSAAARLFIRLEERRGGVMLPRRAVTRTRCCGS